MADEDSSSEVDVLEKLKSELILDYCSSKLWNEFKRGSKMSKGSLKILKDLCIHKQNSTFDEELEKKLYCTRFICGLSEARITTDDGTVKYNVLQSMCLMHAEEILKMYPFSASEQSHFKNTIKLQVILSAYRAGKLSRAKKLFLQLYPEITEEDEEYQDEIQELFQSENESLKQKILLRFSYEKFLRHVCDFLTPLWEKYDIPLLEKFKGELRKVDDRRLDYGLLLKNILNAIEANTEQERTRNWSIIDCYDEDDTMIPGFFIKAYHDCSIPKEEDREASWQSIINQSHPDIKEFKKKLNKGKETTRSEALDQDGGQSIDINKEIQKSNQTIAQLKKSSKQLNDFVKKRNQRSSTNKESDSDDDVTDEDDDDRNITSSKQHVGKKSPTKNKSPLKRSSPFKRRWNDLQKDAEVIEWSLSEDEDHPTLCLPSPKRKLNITLPSPSKRRKKNPWTEEEVTWLTKGVQAYGEGNWSTILRMFAFRFRTAVDLKDKWRNINKQHM